MADYEVGNILVSLETESNKTINSLIKVEKQLGVFSRRLKEIEKINIAKVEVALDRISKIKFNNIVKAFSPLQDLDTKSISTLGSAMRSLSKITNLSKTNLDIEKIEQNIRKLTLAVDPFVQKMIQAEPSLKAFSNALDLQKVNAQLMVAEARVNAINSKAQSKKVLDDIKIEKANIQLEKTKKQLDSVNAKSIKTEKSFSKIFNLGKLYFLFNYTKRFATALAGTMTKAIDFNETLNKFQVSMGDYYQESLKFVNKITYAFNLSTESIMNYQSTFKNMLDALGDLDEGISYQLSESLTQMAIDYASLFNVSVDKAMQQFQSVLSGQIRSIRTTSGYDVSEATIFNIYQSLGGTKTMRQLTQLEKRLLRILAVQQQMERTGAVGDFAKTLNESANLLKQIGDTLVEIGRWFGQLTMVYLKPFLTNVLGTLVAVREILKSINIAQGYEYKDFTEGLFGKTEEEAIATEEAVNSLKRTLLGFDKLNVLSSSKDSNILGTDIGLITNAIKKYESNMQNVKNEANEVSKRILGWLGYFETVNEETGEIVWKLKDGFQNIDKITLALKGILALIGILATKKFVNSLFGNLPTTVKSIKEISSEIGTWSSLFKEFGIVNTLKTLAPITTKIVLIVGAIVGIIAIMTHLYKTNENFRLSVNELWGTLQGVFAEVGKLFMSIVEALTPIFKALIPIVNMLMDFLGELLALLTPVINFVAKAVQIVLKIVNFLDKIRQWLSFTNWFKSPKDTKFEVNVELDELKDITKKGKLNVPKFAKGGIVSKPTIAMVGEYSNASSNPEIITPENKMRQIIMETSLPLIQSVLNGNKELANAIKNRPIILNVDGNKLAETTYGAYEHTAKRLGKNNVVFSN